MTDATAKVIRSYGGKDLVRIWESVKLAVHSGVPLHRALDELRRNQPALFPR